MNEKLEHVLEQFPERFWELVELAKKEREQFRSALSQMSRDELERFYWTYEQAIAELEAPPFTDHVAEDLTEDGFTDLCSWVVGQGRERYFEALTKPDALPRELVRGWFVLDDIVKEYDRRYNAVVPYPKTDDYLMK